PAAPPASSPPPAEPAAPTTLPPRRHLCGRLVLRSVGVGPGLLPALCADDSRARPGSYAVVLRRVGVGLAGSRSRRSAEGDLAEHSDAEAGARRITHAGAPPTGSMLESPLGQQERHVRCSPRATSRKVCGSCSTAPLSKSWTTRCRPLPRAARPRW